MEINLFIVALYSYFLGSIPFGLILTKIFLKQDIRKVGSGNIGTTNVLRTGNKFLAVSTLILDLLKGYVSILITLFFIYLLMFIFATPAHHISVRLIILPLIFASIYFYYSERKFN